MKVHLLIEVEVTSGASAVHELARAAVRTLDTLKLHGCTTARIIRAMWSRQPWRT